MRRISVLLSVLLLCSCHEKERGPSLTFVQCLAVNNQIILTINNDASFEQDYTVKCFKTNTSWQVLTNLPGIQISGTILAKTTEEVTQNGADAFPIQGGDHIVCFGVNGTSGGYRFTC